jgi:hypothetical protein
MRQLFACALPALFTLGLQTPATGQQITRGDLHGIVVDRASGAPLVAASVTLVGRRSPVLTDREGRFRIKGVSAGPITLEVEQLGYGNFSEVRTFVVNGSPMRLELQPDPIVLKGIQVIADRMKSRRNAVATSVRAYTTDQLAMSASFDAYDFIRTRLWVQPCEGSARRLAFSSTCIVRRGSLMSPTVYIDESWHVGGLDDLLGWPTSDLYLIEVYSSGAQVRVYTKQFAEHLAKGRRVLDPVLWY